MLLITSSGLGIDRSNMFFLTVDIISFAVDSGVISGNKPGKLLHNFIKLDEYDFYGILLENH